MEDQYNLIYNGKMLHGMDGYLYNSYTSLDTSDKPTDCYGSFVSNCNTFMNYNSLFFPLIPFILSDRYNLSFKMKDNGTTANNTYCFIMPFDNKGNLVEVNSTTPYPYNGANTITTLAKDLKDGDTTVYLTSTENWGADTNYRALGIIESAAYKDDRAIAVAYIAQNGVNTTNNTLTLRYAWDKGTYKVGSKVREFTGGSTYFYPFNISKANLPSDWTLYSKDIYKNWVSDYVPRFNQTYFISIGIGYGNVKSSDWRFENKTTPQSRIPNMPTKIVVNDYSESTTSVNQYGQLNTGMLSEGFLPVRYIRDWASTRGDGTGAQAYTHWKEIQAFDRWGRNVAFAADGSWSAVIYKDGAINTSRAGLNISNTTTYKPLHVITNEILDDTAYIESNSTTQGNPRSVTIDMGIIHYIDKIIVWHDSQNSNQWHDTKTEVSVDGVNWITVFDSAVEGEYAETADGHTITFDKLGTLYKASFKKGGETLVQDIIED